MSASPEPSSNDDDVPVRKARPGQSGYRDDDYWRKLDEDIDVDAGAPADEQAEDAGSEPVQGHDAESPKEVQPEH